jgi:hypothetical protein
MARSGSYGTKQNKVEGCRQLPMHHPSDVEDAPETVVNDYLEFL